MFTNDTSLCSTDPCSSSKRRLKLHSTEWVEVRSKEEILATLDENGRLDGMQFMPEMFQYCGRVFRVARRAHKTCDPPSISGRRVQAAVHLDDVRCDGEAHGGCQAACLIFWKEAWLRRLEDHEAPSAGIRPSMPPPSSSKCSETRVDAAAIRTETSDNDPIYACQATTLIEATSPLPWWDMRQYIEDYASGNVGGARLLRGAAYSAASKAVGLGYKLGRKVGVDMGSPLMWLYDKVQAQRHGTPYPRKKGSIPKGQRTPDVSQNLQVGEVVRVKSHAEILATLDTDSKNRGLYFDAEHVPYCGGVYRVKARISQIIDETTGKMLHFKTDSIVLENVYCQSRFSYKRMFCPRGIYPYWREIWLERVTDPAVIPGGPSRLPDLAAPASQPPPPVSGWLSRVGVDEVRPVAPAAQGVHRPAVLR